ncbi:hypothetical protein Sta7437_0752 [Stanieria cyanosphaera PCC 7437]|uniref:Uncharacterized protein n=1 Tax=Stanieria cyanosphaera (strain ATCC 29371 / PCC 7437) TaxID=111780 RepID=K9XP86_STAC7|nr:hypothetical protein [Stanieria cyanosphaera]AFZ34343.1 hypothetical protein Sta7437_0752 [Stanieria cyanosphaera PCC 7437]
MSEQPQFYTVLVSKYPKSQGSLLVEQNTYSSTKENNQFFLSKTKCHLLL